MQIRVEFIRVALVVALVVALHGVVAGEPAVGAQGPTAGSRALCVALTPQALGQITSASYASTNSQIDNATLKHCEYRGGANVVSVMLATGPDARTRFDTAAKFPGLQAVSGVGDQANWLPVRGMLSVRAGQRSVEVSVSAGHGTAAVRQQMAVTIAQLALGL